MCTYEDDVLVETCWDSSKLGCAVSDPPCARGHIDPNGVWVLVGHNHHTPCNKAWGKTWTYTGLADDLEAQSLEEHITRLLNSLSNE